MTPKERMEQILGGKITDHRDQPLPGIEDVEGTAVYYFSDTDGLELGEQLARLVRCAVPPRITSGGAIATKHALRTPDGTLYHAIKCRGDLDGWRQQLEEGALLLGLNLGSIQARIAFKTTTGSTVALDECEHVFM